MPERRNAEVYAARDRAADARYALLEARGALAKRPNLVVTARASNPTLGKAARRQEEEAATSFVRARSTAVQVLADVAPVRAELENEAVEVEAQIEAMKTEPEQVAYDNEQPAYNELSQRKHDLFGQMFGKDPKDPAVAAIKAEYDDVKARHGAMQAARMPVSQRRSIIHGRKEEIPVLIRKVTPAIVNLTDEVERAQSSTFEGWGLDPDTPEIHEELASAIAVGEKSASADAAAEQRATQQAGQQVAQGEIGGGGGRSKASIAGLGLAGAAVGALGVGALGAVVGGIAGTFLGSTAIGAAVGAGAGALLGGLIGGGIGLGVGAFSRRGGGRAAQPATDGPAPAAGGATDAAQQAPQTAADARQQDDEQEQQQEQAVAEVQGGAAAATGEDRRLEDSDEPRSKLAVPRGGSTPRAPRRGITWAQDAEDPDTVQTQVQDFDVDEWEREPKTKWGDEDVDPLTGGYGVYPKGQPRRSHFFENSSEGGERQLEEQRRRAPSAFDNAPEPDADEWR